MSFSFTIVDGTGEIVKSINVPDQTHLDENTPPGCTAVVGAPPGWQCYWQAGAWVQKPAQPQPWFTWNANTKAWVDARTLAQAQADQWRLVQEARDVAIYADFTWSGSVFQADFDSQQKIQGAAQTGLGANWVLLDNTIRAMSGADMVSLWAAIWTRQQDAMSKAQALRTQIMAAQSIVAVEAVTW